MSLAARLLPTLVSVIVLAAPAVAQEEMASTTISAIERGEAEGMVYLEGAALTPAEAEDEYLFSDGTGVITIDVADEAGEGVLPLFELIGIEGTAQADGVDVSSWTPLPIVKPAVIVEEPQVIEAFRGWIVAYDSQAPSE